MLLDICVHSYIVLFIADTFHVQSVLINTLGGQVCFECVLLTGNNGVGCFIEYTCGMNTSNNITIINYDAQQSCANIIHTCDYSIIVYDIDSNGTVYTNRPAYQTHTIINGGMTSSSHTTSYQGFDTVQPTITSFTGNSYNCRKISLLIIISVC